MWSYAFHPSVVFCSPKSNVGLHLRLGMKKEATNELATSALGVHLSVGASPSAILLGGAVISLLFSITCSLAKMVDDCVLASGSVSSPWE